MVDMLYENSMISGRIICNREIAKDHFLMSLRVSGNFSSAESPFQKVSPGQFVMLKSSPRRLRHGGEKGSEFPFLGRPISIYSISPDDDGVIVEFLYRVVGKGTHLFSCLKPDEEMHMLGPLGSGFDISPDYSCVILIAGGIGIAPLSFLGEHYRRCAAGRPLEIVCYAGAQRSDLLVGLDRMEEICSDVRISTDDGSSGYHGFVTDLFERDMASYDSGSSVVYSCGPSLMTKRLTEILMDYSLPCQVSVEERMACGIGACLGCAIRVKVTGGETQYKRVCKDGPVFDIKEIDWE